MTGERRSIHGSHVLPFLILCTIKFSHSADTLLPNKSLKDGEVLISINQTFELGFFSPDGSLNRYIGIWYHKVPGQKVVWVGNRGTPVFDTSGYLTIDVKGNLIVLDSIGRLIPIASNPGTTNLTVATLTDTGNLVLKEWSGGREGQALWHSFDNPTDTLIPGMTMGMIGKANRILTSWRSSEDPAQGDFSVGIDPNGTKQFIMWRKGQFYWKSGAWNGKNFSLVLEMTPNYYINFSYTPIWNGDNYSYSLNDSSKPTLTVMDVSGQIKQVAWVDTSQEWVQFWAEPIKLSEPNHAADNGRKQELGIIIILPVSLVMLLLGVFLYCWRRKKLKWKGKQGLKQELQLLGTDNTAVASRKVSGGLMDGEGEKIPDCPLISFSTILGGTSNFSASSKLGEGGFGPVYKGTLEGHEIAVKRLSSSSGQGLVEFRNEISLIANLQHRNLVRLLGYCIQGEEKLLIYEYMPNKSLDLYIFDPIKGAELDWKKRFDIIEGIGQGLLYLHRYSRLKIIHRDLKASNILLDSEMNPKISDFGMARIFGRNETQANTNRVVGTYGYMSPEYAMEGLFSEKSDVFSFGVLLLEILSGKKNRSFHCETKSLNLLGYAWELWKEGYNILELMDPLLGDLRHLEVYSRCIQVALLCVQGIPEDRPTMLEVVYMLSNDSISLRTPKKPIFPYARTLKIIDPQSTTTEACTVNDITVSVMEGR